MIGGAISRRVAHGQVNAQRRVGGSGFAVGGWGGSRFSMAVLLLVRALLDTHAVAPRITTWLCPVLLPGITTGLIIDSPPPRQVSGPILYVFAFESTIRVLGYQRNLLGWSRLLDLVDVLVVLISIVVYVYTLASGGTKEMLVVWRTEWQEEEEEEGGY